MDLAHHLTPAHLYTHTHTLIRTHNGRQRKPALKVQQAGIRTFGNWRSCASGPESSRPSCIDQTPARAGNPPGQTCPSETHNQTYVHSNRHWGRAVAELVERCVWCAAGTGLTPWCARDFSSSQLSVQSLLRYSHSP